MVAELALQGDRTPCSPGAPSSQGGLNFQRELSSYLAAGRFLLQMPEAAKPLAAAFSAIVSKSGRSASHPSWSLSEAGAVSAFRNSPGQLDRSNGAPSCGPQPTHFGCSQSAGKSPKAASLRSMSGFEFAPVLLVTAIDTVKPQMRKVRKNPSLALRRVGTRAQMRIGPDCRHAYGRG